mgnify:CR=1 FL=1
MQTLMNLNDTALVYINEVMEYFISTSWNMDNFPQNFTQQTKVVYSRGDTEVAL